MTRVMAGIDVGGTFTDVITCTVPDNPDAVPMMTIAKTPTTSSNQADGVMNAIQSTGMSPANIDLIVHGTTTTTNAILERKIARCGLITTKGFRDVLELGRRTRPNAYGMTGQFEPLIPRELRLEVDERMDARGNILIPLDEAALRNCLKMLIHEGVEALVIHFLHSYANPANELRAETIAREVWPNNFVTIGHKLISEYREFERGTTASVNAAVQPVLHRYIANLQDRLTEGGYQRDLLVMNGNGGTVSASIVVEEAAKTVMSGPASGVIAAAKTAAKSGVENIITYDMGGTSTDVALVPGGEPSTSSELAIDYGLPIHVPMVDVRTIGAGGGSIGKISAAGLLEVGPESAGSDPGPIAYGRGGTRPTITDANVILGRLRLEAFAGEDKPKISIDDVRQAMESEIAKPLGLTIEAAAAAMIHVANTQMAGAIRMVSLSRGHDPRDFALFAFGGAGPLHAVALARELALPKVLIPARPGLVNALGCLVADLRQDIVNTINRPLEAVDMTVLKAVMTAQREHGVAANAITASEIAETRISHSADMQFRGQTHLIRVTLPGPDITREQVQAIFEKAYFERFQVTLPEIQAVLVNINTAIIGIRPEVPIEALLDADVRKQDQADAVTATRTVMFDGETFDTPIYNRDALPLNARITGPAILEQMDSTVLIEPGTNAAVDGLGNILIDVPLASSASREMAAE